MFRKFGLITLILLIGIIVKVFSQKKEITFELYTNANGLSNSHVNCIAQDSNGFMWFGTDYGLNKFDGFKFVHYINNPNDSASLPSDEVSALYLDKKGFLWVGTYNGLAKFDYRTEKFRNYFINNDSIQFYKPVRAIVEDITGRIWAGTSGKGVLVIDANTGTQLKDLNKRLSHLIGDAYVYTMLIDGNNNLWIGTEDDGVKVYNTVDQSVKHFTSTNSRLKNNRILTLFEDNIGNIWIGTRGGGLSIYNCVNEEFTDDIMVNKLREEIYSFTFSKDSSIWIGTNDGGLIIYNPATKKFKEHSTYAADIRFKSKRIRAIFKDKDGNIWLGIHQLGVSLLKNYNYPFRNSNSKLPFQIQLTNYSILGLLLDSRQNLWLGTDGNGLIKYNVVTKEQSHYLPDKFKKGSLPDNVVRTIYEDKNKTIWIGTYNGGLSRYNEKTDNFKNYFNEQTDPGSISSNDVVAFAEDTKNRLWIATNGGGLNLYNAENETFSRFSSKETENNSTICSDWLTSLYVDSKGYLWIGSFWGLSKFDTENLNFKNYYKDPENANSISNNIVFSINEDKSGNIWFGTKNGLDKLETRTNQFTHYSVSEGLPNEVVNSILADDHNNFWLATNNGLARFNYQTSEVKSFYYQDGLVSNEFIHNSRYKSTNGQLFFGSVAGFNSFYPDSIRITDFFPTVLITDFKIFNNSVPIGKLEEGRTIIEQSITETTQIKLDYYDNSFSFEFVALDYILPERIMYACKMDGFEENWNYLNYERRFITYTNLDPGTYTFMVKASSRKDEWGEEVTQITINIRPPIWKTGWAYFVYIVLLSGITLFIWKLNFDRLNEKNQLRIERLKQAQLEQLNQSKLEFFTNISHEFRTPLTLIIGPIENLLENEKLGMQVKKSLNMMLRNAHRLLRLVNQLLDLRKIEKGKLKLQAKETDLIPFIRDIYESFDELARRKKINYEFVNNDDKLVVYFDHEKLDKILFNLLSNAFKFTPDGGKIRLIVNKPEKPDIEFPYGYVQIAIEDNGKGVNPSDINQIFERFYQSPDQVDTIQKGTGIGLSLTKSLVEIHHGKIQVESKKGEGSLFLVNLPLGNAHLNKDEIIFTDTINAIENEHQPVVLEGYDEISFMQNNDNEADDAAPLILLVEDNEDVRTYIKDGLKGKYRIEEAENGKIAFKKTHDLMPDLIISDVMMPEMDGITFCKKIKSDLISCHIPVILLTAKTSIEHRIEGLETGADSYIPKPFNPRHLIIRIEKLIELRRTLKNKFKNDINFEPVEMAITSADERFMKKAIDTIKQKISDSELGVESLGEEIGMSRGHLHRKLKALVGQTPSEFIRTIRLKQAAYLLANEDIPVSEVSYLVGFSSPSYFTSCFTKQYGQNPTQFKETNQTF